MRKSLDKKTAVAVVARRAALKAKYMISAFLPASFCVFLYFFLVFLPCEFKFTFS